MLVTCMLHSISMKIATYNIRNLYDSGTFIDEKAENAVTEEFFNKRVDHFSSIFKEKDLDIVCLQEVGGDLGIKKIAENSNYDYFCARPNKRGIRVAVLYKKDFAQYIRTESLSLGELHFPSILKKDDTEMFPPLTQRRDVLALDLELPGKKPIKIVVFHLKSLIPEFLEGEDTENDVKAYADAKFRSILYKMMELRALRAFATKSIEEGKEVIFLGDFNEHNKGSTLEILKGSNIDIMRLYDVMSFCKGDITTIFHRGTPLTFDTMLVSQGLSQSIECVSVENKDLKDYSILPFGEIENVVEADHAMVITEIA